MNDKRSSFIKYFSHNLQFRFPSTEISVVSALGEMCSEVEYWCIIYNVFYVATVRNSMFSKITFVSLFAIQFSHRVYVHVYRNVEQDKCHLAYCLQLYRWHLQIPNRETGRMSQQCMSYAGASQTIFKNIFVEVAFSHHHRRWTSKKDVLRRFLMHFQEIGKFIEKKCYFLRQTAKLKSV